MRALIFLVVVLLFERGAFAQGTILFDTHVPGIVDAPFSLNHLPPGPSFGAELFLADVVSGNFLPLSPTTTFKTSSFDESFYVEPVVVAVPGHEPGSKVDVVMGIFLLSNPSSFCEGQSITTVTLGGGDLPPGYLAGMGPSDGPPDCIPEPPMFGLLSMSGLVTAILSRKTERRRM
jgi:hypothetical protein